MSPARLVALLGLVYIYNKPIDAEDLDTPTGIDNMGCDCVGDRRQGNSRDSASLGVNWFVGARLRPQWPTVVTPTDKHVFVVSVVGLRVGLVYNSR